MSRLEFDNSKSNEKYKFETIWDNTVYVKETEDYLLGLYYLIS